MKYLPRERITYRTNLKPVEILSRLNDILEPKRDYSNLRAFYGSGNHKPYEGNIKDHTFYMSRTIAYRNSFLPQIRGVVEADLNGSKVNVKMDLHSMIGIFMLIWASAVGLACLAVLITLGMGGDFDLFMLIPFGMLVFGYGLVTIGFKLESARSKKDLATLFEAKTNPESDW